MTRLDPSVPNRLTGTLAVLRRNLRVWRRFMLASAAGDLAEPVLYLIALGYGLGAMITDVQGMSYIRFIAPGLVIVAILYSASFEATYGTFTRMVPQHTFEGVLATPVGVSEVVLAEILYAATKSTVAGCAVVLVVAALGLFESWSLALVPLLCILCGFMFGGLAVLVTCLSPSYDFFNYYFTLAMTPMVLFGGVFFPLEQLPVWAWWICWANPLTHAAQAAHHLFAGNLDMDLVGHLAWLGVAAGLPIWPAIKLMRRRLIR